MDINLETEKDFITFVTSGKTLLEELEPNSKVTIKAELLTTVVNDHEALIDRYERKIKGYESRIRSLNNKLKLESINLVEETIEEVIETSDDSEADIEKSVVKLYKEELANLKAEKDLSSVDFDQYIYLWTIHESYNLEPEAIIDKVERDLAEIEA